MFLTERMLLAVALVFSFVRTSCLAQSGPSRGVPDLSPFRWAQRAVYVNSNSTIHTEISSTLTTDHYLDVAKELVQAVAAGAAFRVVGDHYIDDNGVAHVYFRQMLHGIDIENSDFNVNVSMKSFPSSLEVQ
ncbi:extracellular metallo proteinase MEP [Penicillium malachiteum]|uniref:extracellular metallo proteinase MEP n=1 Tax=Penicillium malachiteum TaxID=1324776 RepID=UPI002547007A|nr:extracellular metallo proteinase MEP [Penicillium malachiteum]KAJ5731394.1 extracellular metallo proteinase MEP [Penicillium malachiteum]